MNREVEPWGRWGGKPGCSHLWALRQFLENSKMSVWSEHGESPYGWVNVNCKACHRTYELTLQEPWETE